MATKKAFPPSIIDCKVYERRGLFYAAMTVHFPKGYGNFPIEEYLNRDGIECFIRDYVAGSSYATGHREYKMGVVFWTPEDATVFAMKYKKGYVFDVYGIDSLVNQT